MKEQVKVSIVYGKKVIIFKQFFHIYQSIYWLTKISVHKVFFIKSKFLQRDFIWMVTNIKILFWQHESFLNVKCVGQIIDKMCFICKKLWLIVLKMSWIGQTCYIRLRIALSFAKSCRSSSIRPDTGLLAGSGRAVAVVCGCCESMAWIVAWSSQNPGKPPDRR